MAKTLVEKIKEKRNGYAERTEAERLYLDSYAGTGGFQGRTAQPTSSFWGWAADAYAQASDYRNAGHDDRDTYLDRFDREDEKKFQRRKRVVHYENHVAPCVDIPLSYLKRKPFTRTGVPESVSQWQLDADGCGTTWDTLLFETILLRGAVLGSCPVLFDLPPVPENESNTERTRAQDIAEGRSIRAIPLFGCNVWDWKAEGSGFEWIKLGWDVEERASPLDEATCTTEVRFVYKDRIELYRITKDEAGREVASEVPEIYPHPFGDVPVVIFRPKVIDGCPMRGISLVHDIASEARRLFNLHSELDEHIRSSVFAFLQVPTRGAKKAEVTIGSSAALSIDAESKQGYAWIAPPESVAKTLETRIENTISSIYAMARLEFSRGKQVTASASGLSRAYEFESTNRAISDIAGKLAAFDARALDLILDVLAPDVEAVGEEIRTSPAQSYDVEELDKELATVETAARLRLGPTAMAESRKRLVRQINPQMSAEKLAAADQEIDDLAQSEATQAMQMDAAAGFGGPMPDPNAAPSV